ncbi:MAG: tetratricopeptide repeat protein, partial [Candidatus Omnitrophica bacterium]|nr:tetratricopeptide repeat protein [Candidatus Omnitrophota bacterium]
SFHLYSYWEWTPQTGKWINPKYAVKDTAEEQFNYAEEFRKNGKIEIAIREHKKLLKHYPKSQYAPSSCLILGQIYKEIGDTKKAFEYFQKIIDDYPASQLVFSAIKLQSEIADKKLEEKKGIFKFLHRKENPKYMSKVLENNPYDLENVERMFKLAEFYYGIKSYNESIEVLNKIIKNFSQTEYTEKAKFLKIKYSIYSIPDINYDTDLIEDIREEIISFTIEYPESKFKDEIENIKTILDEKEAEKYYQIARYYEKAGKKKSAVYYYQKLLNKFPDTKYGKIAYEKVNTIK